MSVEDLMLTTSTLAGSLDHNLAKVGVEGSNPFARSSFSSDLSNLRVAFFLLSFVGTSWSTPVQHGVRLRAGRIRGLAVNGKVAGRLSSRLPSGRALM